MENLENEFKKLYQATTGKVADTKVCWAYMAYQYINQTLFDSKLPGTLIISHGSLFFMSTSKD